MILVISLICVAFVAKSQEPISPELCYVTVRVDSVSQLFWHHQDTANIDGFIIKRLIFDGTGVIDGTLNNIAVIEDNSITSFKDTVNEFNTYANPYFRSEQYSVSAFLYRNDSVILSNMTLAQKTVLLSANWDFCTQTANINWTRYINKNVIKYNLYYGTDQNNMQFLDEFSSSDTSFTSQSFLQNTQYYFKIEAVIEQTGNCEQVLSFSNFANFTTSATVVSDTLKNIYVTTNDNSYLEVMFYCSDNYGIKKFVLERSNSDGIVELKEFSQNTKFLNYNDLTEVNFINNYRIKVVDICGVQAFETDYFNNLVLNVVEENKTYKLSWNDIFINENTPSFYDVEVKFNGSWQLFETFSGLTTLSVFSYEDIFNSNLFNTDLQSVSFRLRAEYDTIIVHSNIVELPVKGIFAIPNAFNPLSSDNENSYFTIKAEFINDFSLVVFTETGSILFKSDDINNRWSGRYAGGQLVERGAYIYRIKYIDNIDNEQQLNGIINVVY